MIAISGGSGRTPRSRRPRSGRPAPNGLTHERRVTTGPGRRGRGSAGRRRRPRRCRRGGRSPRCRCGSGGRGSAARAARRRGRGRRGARGADVGRVGAATGAPRHARVGVSGRRRSTRRRRGTRRAIRRTRPARRRRSDTGGRLGHRRAIGPAVPARGLATIRADRPARRDGCPARRRPPCRPDASTSRATRRSSTSSRSCATSTTEPKKFREVVRELSWLLGYEALADARVRPLTIQTPIEEMEARRAGRPDRARPDPARRAGHGRRDARAHADRRGLAPRPLPRRADAAAGRVLQQAARLGDRSTCA